jgi:hypothetical protein
MTEPKYQIGDRKMMYWVEEGECCPKCGGDKINYEWEVYSLYCETCEFQFNDLIPDEYLN